MSPQSGSFSWLLLANNIHTISLLPIEAHDKVFRRTWQTQLNLLFSLSFLQIPSPCAYLFTFSYIAHRSSFVFFVLSYPGSFFLHLPLPPYCSQKWIRSRRWADLEKTPRERIWKRQNKRYIACQDDCSIIFRFYACVFFNAASSYKYAKDMHLCSSTMYGFELEDFNLITVWWTSHFIFPVYSFFSKMCFRVTSLRLFHYTNLGVQRLRTPLHHRWPLFPEESCFFWNTKTVTMTYAMARPTRWLTKKRVIRVERILEQSLLKRWVSVLKESREGGIQIVERMRHCENNPDKFLQTTFLEWKERFWK